MSEVVPHPLTGTLRKLVAGQDLTPIEVDGIVGGLLDGSLPDPLAGALLAALATKGESVEEIRAFASHLRQRARPFLPDETRVALDLCGTGGAPTPSFNISTLGAVVVAAGKVPVTKHGNVSARGPCGSSDLLLALGLPVTTSIAFAEASFRREGLAFLHAPLYHSATTKVGPLRRTLGIRTVFNLLGPLTNPSSAKTHVVGAFSSEYAEKAREVLTRDGATAVAAVHGGDGTDEFTSKAPSKVLLARGERREEVLVDPAKHLRPDELDGDLASLPPPASAALAVKILQGGRGARRGAILLTAGLAFWVSGAARDLGDGIEAARSIVDGGEAHRKLAALQSLAQEAAWT